MHPERQLVRPDLRLVAASETDFRSLYDALYQPVASYLWRRLGDRHATEDVLHDVFLAAFRALGRFQDRGTPLRHWVFRIANRAASRRLRLQRRELRTLARRVPRGPQASPPGDATVTAADSLRALLAALPRALQEPVSLHYLADLPVADVASILGVATGTVKSRLSRARVLLRAHLAGGPP